MSVSCLLLAWPPEHSYSSYSNVKTVLSFLPSTSLLTATSSAPSPSIIESCAPSTMLGPARWGSGSNPDTLLCLCDLCRMYTGMLCPGGHRQVCRYLWPPACPYLPCRTPAHLQDQIYTLYQTKGTLYSLCQHALIVLGFILLHLYT